MKNKLVFMGVVMGIFLCLPLHLSGFQKANAPAGVAPAAEKIKMGILYVGQPDSDRTKDFLKLLSENFTKVELCPQDSFKEDKTADFDVVVFDYLMARRARGERGVGGQRPAPPQFLPTYAKPTVLFGSFGARTCLNWLKPKTSYT